MAPRILQAAGTGLQTATLRRAAVPSNPLNWRGTGLARFVLDGNPNLPTMSLIFETIQAEGIAELSYLLGDDSSGTAAVIDPTPDVEK